MKYPLSIQPLVWKRTAMMLIAKIHPDQDRTKTRLYSFTTLNSRQFFFFKKNKKKKIKKKGKRKKRKKNVILMRTICTYRWQTIRTAEEDTCQKISTLGPMPRKTTEHSGNSPRSAYSDSSSSLIGKNIATSESPALLSAKIGLSSIVDDVVSMSLNHLNSSLVVINDDASSLPRSANLSS